MIECCEGKWTVVEEGGGDEVVVEGESGTACGLARWKGAKVEDEGGAGTREAWSRGGV